MQNSVWKLTALAGVVGIGFLIMLQVQRGLQDQNEQSQAGDGEIGSEESGNEAGDSNETGPFGLGQFEPTAAGDSEFEQTDSPQDEFAEFQNQNAEPRYQQPPESQQGEPGQDSENLFSRSNFGENNDFEASRDTSTSSFASNQTQPRQPTRTEAAYPDNRGVDFRDGSGATFNSKSAAARPATSDDSFAAQPFNPFASEDSEDGSTGDVNTASPAADSAKFASGENFTQSQSATTQDNAAPTIRSESTRKMVAQALVRDARRDLDAGQFDIARQKAIEAGKLRVRYGDLEDRPALLLMDIDRIAQNKTSGNSILQTGATSKSARVNAESSAGDLDGPSLFPSATNDRFGSDDEKNAAGVARVSPSTPNNERVTTRSTRDSVTQGGTGRGLDLTPVESEPIGKPAGRPHFRLDSPSEERPMPLFSGSRSSSDPNSAPQFTNRNDENVAQTAASDQQTPTATDEPQRLLPAPNAVQLDPADDDLAGTGTIGADAPQGQQHPQLKIEKLAPPNATLGQPMIYSIVVTNHGKSPAHQVVIEDQIPKGSRLSGTIPRAELTGQKLLWRIGSLKPGEEKKLLIKIVPTAKGEIGSIATVNFVAEVAAKTVVTAPSLDLKLLAPSKAKLGEPVVFQFKLTNSGNGDATGVFLRDIIPNALKHADGNDLEYEVGTIRAGETRDIKLTLTAVKPGQTVNRATITAEGGFETDATVTVEIIGSQLVLTRTGPQRRILGRPAVYSNQVTNDSDFPVTGITIVETIPDGFAFSAAPSGGQYNAGKHTIAWRIDQLGPQQSKTVQATFIPKTQGIHKSVVTAFDGSGSQTQITSQTVVIGLASLESDFSIVEGAVAIGEQVTVRLSLRNRGNSPDRDVALKLIIPPELQFVSARGPVRYTESGNEIQFQPIDEISGGRSFDFDIVVKALKAGDARLKAQLQSDQLTRPLNTEEAIVIFSDSE